MRRRASRQERGRGCGDHEAGWDSENSHAGRYSHERMSNARGVGPRSTSCDVLPLPPQRCGTPSPSP
eukprot:5770250-Pyramimonas_sp.AAC.1